MNSKVFKKLPKTTPNPSKKKVEQERRAARSYLLGVLEEKKGKQSMSEEEAMKLANEAKIKSRI